MSKPSKRTVRATRVADDEAPKLHRIHLTLTESEIGTLVSLGNVMAMRPLRAWDELTADFAKVYEGLSEFPHPDDWTDEELTAFLRPILLASAIVVIGNLPELLHKLRPDDIKNELVRNAISSYIQTQAMRKEKDKALENETDN